LITARPEKAEKIVKKLKDNNIDSSVVGTVVDESEGINVVDKGVEKPLNHPRIDPFWAAYANEMGKL
jgi:hydrogenase maturation factor